MLQDAPQERQLRRYALAVTQSDQKRRNDPVISADGYRIVYEQGGALWVRELDQLEPRQLEGTETAERRSGRPTAPRSDSSSAARCGAFR